MAERTTHDLFGGVNKKYTYGPFNLEINLGEKVFCIGSSTEYLVFGSALTFFEKLSVNTTNIGYCSCQPSCPTGVEIH